MRCHVAPSGLLRLAVALLVAGLASSQQFTRQAKTHAPFVADDWGDVATGDIDGDGDPDLVLTTDCGPVRVLRNDGLARFTDVAAAAFAPAPVPIGSAGVALGDVDGDGDLDLVLGQPGPAPTVCRLLLNDGAGVFNDATASWVPPLLLPLRANRIALHDVDGDSDNDMVLGCWSTVLLYLNTGGSFVDRSATNMPAAGSGTVGFLLGDVDRDNDPDLVLAVHNAPYASRNRLFLNTGGVFTDVSTTHLPATQSFTLGLALGDVDGDGDPDLLIANGETNSLAANQDELWLNDGRGVFTAAPPGSLPADDDDGEDCALLDVDGDRDLDVVIANWGQTRCYRNDGSGRFTDATSALWPSPPLATFVLAAGDWDGDGRTDLYLSNSLEPDRVLLQHPGGFVDGSAEFFASTGPGVQDIAIGDFDRDGLPDLYLACGARPFTSVASSDSLFLNSVAGLRDASGRLPIAPTDTRQVVALDFDGDGDLDLVRADDTWPPRRASVLLANDGWATFSDATANLGAAGALPTSAVAAGDVDGDGAVDLALSVTSGMGVFSEVLLRNVGGVFTDVSALLPGGGGAFVAPTDHLAFGDVDGDGDLDLLMAASPDRLYLSHWPAPFSIAPFPVGSSVRLVLADTDGDGDLDVLAVNQNGACRMYANGGAGAFTDVTARLPAIGGATSVAVADVDEDGDLDVAVGRGNPHSSASQNHLLLNDGSGRFSDATATRLLAGVDDTQAVAFGDLDGDGDVDLVVGNGEAYLPCAPGPMVLTQTYVLANRHRQVHAPVLAQLGGMYRLEFDVEPGYATGAGARALIPLLGLGPAPLATSPLVLPFGAFWLTLPVTILPVMTVPVSGSVTLQFPIPAVPALIGLQLASQAVVLHTTGRLAMTNAVADWPLR